MHILRQLPFREDSHTIDFGGEVVPIRAYQIIVWVSLSVQDTLDKGARRFPAVLDSGHSHNFSIRENQLLLWAGLRSEEVDRLGIILVNQEEVPLIAARLWIHRNRPGTTELLPRPVRLDVPQGIAVYPS